MADEKDPEDSRSNSSDDDSALSKTVPDAIDSTVESIDATVDGSESLETLQLDSSQTSSDRAGEATISGSNEATLALDSPLNDNDVTRTINPRELSKQDSQAWDDLTVGSIEGPYDADARSKPRCSRRGPLV